jgi:hypothetical protein
MKHAWLLLVAAAVALFAARLTPETEPKPANVAHAALVAHADAVAAALRKHVGTDEDEAKLFDALQADLDAAYETSMEPVAAALSGAAGADEFDRAKFDALLTELANGAEAIE